MKLLDRYLLREVENPFLIGLAAFLTVLCLNMVYFVLDLIVEKDAPIREILQLIVLRLPFFLVLAMPVAVLLSVSLAVSRITRDRELIALRMAGLLLPPAPPRRLSDGTAPRWQDRELSRPASAPSKRANRARPAPYQLGMRRRRSVRKRNHARQRHSQRDRGRVAGGHPPYPPHPPFPPSPSSPSSPHPPRSTLISPTSF